MKILIADDQKLVLLSLEKCLQDLNYTTVKASSVKEAIRVFDAEIPDLAIIDINMPDAANLHTQLSGLDVVKHIKKSPYGDTPIMILSGNTDEDIIIQAFNMGVDDYMKKPLSLSEIGVRIKRLIGSVKTEKENTQAITPNNKARIIQNACVGVVIPCYNEEKRLLSKEFNDFIHKNLGYHLCFVNDGSTDNTLQVLQELCKGQEDHLSIYNCPKNGGKAEAVRLGMLHLAKDPQFDYIGFLDADLSTDFEDYQDLVDTISESDFKIVSGARISRMGANITKESARKIISQVINKMIRGILEMDFMDTQCGAKIMRREIVEQMFSEKFITRWLFDVEIFMRMKKIYGKEEAKKYLAEKPLNRWVHADGSKLSYKDSAKIGFQLFKIWNHYR